MLHRPADGPACSKESQFDTSRGFSTALQRFGEFTLRETPNGVGYLRWQGVTHERVLPPDHSKRLSRVNLAVNPTMRAAGDRARRRVDPIRGNAKLGCRA